MSLSSIVRNLPDPLNALGPRLPAVQLTYDGNACLLVIENDVLRTEVTGGSGFDLIFELSDLTLGALVAAVNEQVGYTAEILDSFTAFRGAAGLPEAAFGAWALGETRQDIVQNGVLAIPQSALLLVLRPLAAAIARFAAGVQGIVAQSDLTRAAGVWLSDWGDLYGLDRTTTSQGALESDAAYRRRLYLELLAPRSDNLAMKAIIRDRWPVADVAVEDDLTPATPEDQLLASRGLPFTRENPFHFWARINLGPFGGWTASIAGLVDLVQRIKPWGTSWDPLLVAENEEPVPRPSDAATMLGARSLEDVRRARDANRTTAIQRFLEPLGSAAQRILTVRPVLPASVPVERFLAGDWSAANLLDWVGATSYANTVAESGGVLRVYQFGQGANGQTGATAEIRLSTSCAITAGMRYRATIVARANTNVRFVLSFNSNLGQQTGETRLRRLADGSWETWADWTAPAGAVTLSGLDVTGLQWGGPPSIPASGPPPEAYIELWGPSLLEYAAQPSLNPDNPINDGNVTRRLVGNLATDATFRRSILAGPRLGGEPWVVGLRDTFFDTTGQLDSETVRRPTETDLIRLSVEETVRRETETLGGSIVALGTDPVDRAAHAFRLLQTGSRLSRTGPTLLGHAVVSLARATSDMLLDVQDGVAVRVQA